MAIGGVNESDEILSAHEIDLGMYLAQALVSVRPSDAQEIIDRARNQGKRDGINPSRIELIMGTVFSALKSKKGIDIEEMLRDQKSGMPAENLGTAPTNIEETPRVPITAEFPSIDEGATAEESSPAKVAVNA